jgi:hypothetical protein
MLDTELLSYLSGFVHKVKEIHYQSHVAQAKEHVFDVLRESDLNQATIAMIALFLGAICIEPLAVSLIFSGIFSACLVIEWGLTRKQASATEAWPLRQLQALLQKMGIQDAAGYTHWNQGCDTAIFVMGGLGLLFGFELQILPMVVLPLFTLVFLESQAKNPFSGQQGSLLQKISPIPLPQHTFEDEAIQSSLSQQWQSALLKAAATALYFVLFHLVPLVIQLVVIAAVGCLAYSKLEANTPESSPAFMPMGVYAPVSAEEYGAQKVEYVLDADHSNCHFRSNAAGSSATNTEHSVPVAEEKIVSDCNPFQDSSMDCTQFIPSDGEIVHEGPWQG